MSIFPSAAEGARPGMRLRVLPYSMKMRRARRAVWASTLLLAGACGGGGGTNPPGSTEFAIRRIVDTGGPETSVRLVRDPASNALFVLERNGDVFRLTVPAQGAASLARLYGSADTGVSD